MKESKRAAVMRNVAQILVHAKVDLSKHWAIPLIDELNQENAPLSSDKMKEMINNLKNRKA